MKLSRPHSLPGAILVCYGLMLTLLLTACDTSSSSATTPKPTPTPAPTLTTYTGNGYTIGYPKGWTYKKDSQNRFAVLGQLSKQEVPPTITFTDSLGINTLTIGVLPDPNGLLPANTALKGVSEVFQSAMKNYKKVPIAAQTTAGGQTWDQEAATGDITQQGAAVSAKTVSLACTYSAQSAKTQLYFIAYAGPALTFDNVNRTAFQPMLQSFLFA